MLTSHSRMAVGMDGALQTHRGKGSNAGAQRCCWSCNFQAGEDMVCVPKACYCGPAPVTGDENKQT